MEYCHECKPPCEIWHRKQCRKWAKVAAQKKAEHAVVGVTAQSTAPTIKSAGSSVRE